MTLHKVISEDSMSAMDEISKVLGNEAVILSTKKNNGKIEIIGSNDIKDVLKSKKNKHSKTNLNFQDLFIKQPLKNKPNLENHKKKDELKDNVQLDRKNDNKEEITIDAFNNFKKEINNLLENMIITDSSTVSNSYDKSNFLKLIKKGYSRNVIHNMFTNLENLEKAKNEINFYTQLSSKLIFPNKEKLNDSSVIFVTGLSGVGKTTLSAKIASFLLDKNTTVNQLKNISLINFSPKSSNKVSDLINYGRLLNINVHSLSNLDDLNKFIIANKNRKLIIDVSKDFLIQKSFIDFINQNMVYFNSLLMLAIQSGANKKSVASQMLMFDKLNPVIALTKLDETILGAEELSTFAETNCKIGLLSSSKNIIDALVFAKEEVLAQYMNEM